MRLFTRYFLCYFVYFILVSIPATFATPAWLVDILLLILLIGSLVGGVLLLLSQWCSPKLILFLNIFLITIFYFCLGVVVSLFLRGGQAGEGEVIRAFGNFLWAPLSVVAFTRSLAEILLIGFSFYGILNSVKSQHMRSFFSPFLILTYIAPFLFILFVIVAVIGKAILGFTISDMPFRDVSYLVAIFLTGLFCVFSFPFVFFFLPGTVIYLKHTRQASLKTLLDPAGLARKILLPLMILIPVGSFLWALVPGFPTLPYLVNLLYIPLLGALVFGLSQIKKSKQSGYIILIVVAGLFVFSFLTLASLFVGLLIIFSAIQEMRSLSRKEEANSATEK